MEEKKVRKEGIGYLPQFDNTEHTIYKLLNFYMEKKGRIELRKFLDENFRQKKGNGWSDNTIRMLQNTLCSYGLIKEVEDYVYVITDEGRHWLNYGTSEDLVMLIHDHVKYIGELLGELEQQKLTRVELEKRAEIYYGLKLNKTDLTRRIQILKGTGNVTVNRHKEYMLTETGCELLEKMRLKLDKRKCIEKLNGQISEQKQQEISQRPITKQRKKTDFDEIQIIYKLQERFIYYFAKHNLMDKIVVLGELKFKNNSSVEKITPDLMIYERENDIKNIKLVIEIISDKTRDYDFTEKLFKYQILKVEECWMVDYTSGNIMVFDWKKGCFRMLNIFEKNCFDNYPGLQIDFSDLKTKNTVDFL